jgi:hypothetical protein
MPAFTTPGPIAATVEVAGAQVRVGASDRTDTVVLVELHMAAVRIGEASADLDLTNGTGGFDIDRADGSAALVDANSERGTVRNSVPPRENPGTVENKVTVRARTRHGDITIHRAGTPR